MPRFGKKQVYQIEEAVVADRFLLAVAEHPKGREKNYFFFAAAFFAGAFLPAFAAFFLATVALLTEPTGVTSRTRLANRAETSLTNHHTLMSDLSTVIDRGELLARMFVVPISAKRIKK